MEFAASSPNSKRTGVMVLDRFDFILRMRLRGRSAVFGFIFLGVLGLSLLLFLVLANGTMARVLYFPSINRSRLVAEERILPRHRSLEENIRELAEGVLLGPIRHDALRIFPRGGTVISSMVRGRFLYLDLSSRVLSDDPEVPLRGQAALDALSRSIRSNFPRIRAIIYFIDGQSPRFIEEKKI
jgi:hypothetical protein